MSSGSWRGEACAQRGLPPMTAPGRAAGPWADILARYGPHTTCGNRFRRWRKRGIWDRLLDAASKAYDGDLQMIDATSVRVHQHAACAQKKRADPVAWVARAAA